MIPETGDIIFASKKSIIARFMGIFQKDIVIWGHILVVKNATSAWEAHFLLREINLDKVFKKYKYYKIIRKKDLTELQKDIMRKEAPKLLGKRYSVYRIWLQLLDHVFKTNRFTNKFDTEDLQVCSSYGAWIYDKACGYKFNGVEWESCDPDDIEDDQIKYPDRWSTLLERELPKWLKERRLKRSLKRGLKNG